LLLNTNGKRNAWAVRQVNAERIGIARGQIACIHVEVPHPTREGEGNVGNGRIASFVDLVDRAPNLALDLLSAVTVRCALLMVKVAVL
jgi:hypothetical protein